MDPGALQLVQRALGIGLEVLDEQALLTQLRLCENHAMRTGASLRAA
jgi:hypothetical protein